MSDAAWIAFAGAIPPTIMALAALIASWRNGRKVESSTKKIEELHVLVNSRLTQLLELTAKSSRAEGVAEGAHPIPGPKPEPSA